MRAWSTFAIDNAGTLFIGLAPGVGVVRLLCVTTVLVIGLRSPLDATKQPLPYVR